MTLKSSRREFVKAIGVGSVAALAPQMKAAPTRKLKIGHTGITWGFQPPDAEPAIRDIAALGYQGYESFGSFLEPWEKKGGLGQLLEQHNLPMMAAYCGANLTDPTRRKDEIAKMVRWGTIMKKYGGRVCVIGPNNVDRATFDIKPVQSHIITTLNEMCKALKDIDMIGALHQHTGTCVETRDEVYRVMEAVDTNYVTFGPDVAQLQKGGADPVKIVSDFKSTIAHVHLKDWDGGPYCEGYCPLGQGKVDIPKILDLLEESAIPLNASIIMAELDPTPNMPFTPLEAARTSKEYLVTQGYKFTS